MCVCVCVCVCVCNASCVVEHRKEIINHGKAKTCIYLLNLIHTVY